MTSSMGRKTRASHLILQSRGTFPAGSFQHFRYAAKNSLERNRIRTHKNHFIEQCSLPINQNITYLFNPFSKKNELSVSRQF